MPLKMPLEFLRLSLTETTLSQRGNRVICAGVGMIITCKQIIKYNMKFNVYSVRSDVVHCGIKVRLRVEPLEFRESRGNCVILE